MQNGGVFGSGKPATTPTLRRFRTMLSEREEDAVISTDEIVNLYEIALSELTLNSKPLITDLTIIADEQREHARGISEAICCRILEAPVEQKLPSLYLLDSIVKNVGGEYIEHFSLRLPEVFCHAYRQVHPNMQPAMRHLFGFWSTIFPSSVLAKIESHLQFTPPLRASESPRPIHLNPKFMNTRHQFGHPNVEPIFQPQRGFSTTSKKYSLKLSTGYDSDDMEVGVGSIHVGPTSFRARIKRSLSPPLREFNVDNSPRKLRYNNGVDLARPRHLIDTYGIDKRKNHEDPMDINGVNKRWQNIEEEEYNWEDMSPTLAHKNVFSRSLRPTHDVRTNWSNQTQLINGSSMSQNIPSISSGHSLHNIDHSSRYHHNNHEMPFRGHNLEYSAPEIHLNRPHIRPLIPTFQPIRSHLTNLTNYSGTQVHNTLPQFSNQQVGPSNSLNYGYTPRGPQFIQNLNPNMHLVGPMQAPSPVLQNVPNPSTGPNISNLVNSLMAQGLISLTNKSSTQEPVGLEFDPEVLKDRHENAITALYTNLPRQCTACGLRFKSQELHSTHMDWHVTKNRILKNRKQKPSRKWFVSVEMWLTGAAESLGADPVSSFAVTENVVEMKDDDQELAVPADDDQKVCALCGESFDDFYSDEKDEWMYKGAVYMNGSIQGMDDKSRLGPIVHAKCRPETVDTDYSEEGSQRKRMRI